MLIDNTPFIMPCIHHPIDCPCTKQCPRHGVCCACVAHHKKAAEAAAELGATPKLPACLRGIEWGKSE